MKIIVSRVSNLNLEIFNRRWRVPSFLQGDSEIHADVCRVQGFFEAMFNTSNAVSLFFFNNKHRDFSASKF